MGAISMRVYKEDRERWKSLLSERGVKAAEIFSEVLDANRAMKALRLLMEIKNNFISNNKDSEDVEVVKYTCRVLSDWIISTEDTFDKVLDYTFEEVDNKLDYSLELLNYENNVYYEDYQKLVNNFKGWIQNINNTLKEIESIKEKLSNELPKSFIEDASMLEALDKYRKNMIEDKYLTTIEVLTYIDNH